MCVVASLLSWFGCANMRALYSLRTHTSGALEKCHPTCVLNIHSLLNSLQDEALKARSVFFLVVVVVVVVVVTVNASKQFSRSML